MSVLLTGAGTHGGAAVVVSYSTWNPADYFVSAETSLTFSNGDKTVTAGYVSGFNNIEVRGTASNSSGKKYFEVTVTLRPLYQWGVGICDATRVFDGGGPGSMAGGDDDNGVTWASNGNVDNGGFTVNFGQFNLGVPDITAVETGDILGFAVDLDADLIWVRYNGTWQSSVSGTSDPATGAFGCPLTGVAASVFPYCVMRPGTSPDGSLTINTGASAFSVSPPSGFTAWG